MKEIELTRIVGVYKFFKRIYHAEFKSFWDARSSSFILRSVSVGAYSVLRSNCRKLKGPSAPAEPDSGTEFWRTMFFCSFGDCKDSFKKLLRLSSF